MPGFGERILLCWINRNSWRLWETSLRGWNFQRHYPELSTGQLPFGNDYRPYVTGTLQSNLVSTLGMLKTGPRVSRGFLYVSYPPRIELWTLDENSKKKKNEKECVKAVLYIVILEYSLYSKLSCCIRFIQGTQSLKSNTSSSLCGRIRN